MLNGLKEAGQALLLVMLDALLVRVAVVVASLNYCCLTISLTFLVNLIGQPSASSS